MEAMIVGLFQIRNNGFSGFRYILILLYCFSVNGSAENNEILDEIWRQNFGPSSYIGMPESDLLSKQPDLIRRTNITKNKIKYTDLIHKVSPEMFFWYRSVDGRIRSFQVFERNPGKLYLLGEKSSFGEGAISACSLKKMESLRMTNEQVTYIQPVSLLEFKGENTCVAFSSGPEERNLVIFDAEIFGFNDLFASSSEQARFNEHVKSLKIKGGFIEDLDDRALKLHPPIKPDDISYVFRPEMNSVESNHLDRGNTSGGANRVESGEVIVERMGPKFQWLYAVFIILVSGGLLFYFKRIR